MRKERLELTEAEHQKLQEIVCKGKNKARVITRARILLLSHEGRKDQQIADALHVGRATVERIRRRAVREGVEAALVDRPRPGSKRKLNDRQEAQLVAIACSVPPPGRKRWTIRLLMEEVVKQKVVDSISFETVRRVLKKNDVKPWQIKRWCIPKVTDKFLQAMFAILDLYAQPYDPRHPKVCFDEKSKELHAEKREPLPMKAGQPTRQDYEYKRNGTRNLFVFVEPQSGFRHVLVTRRRTKLEFAYAMRYLVDVLYPDAEWIDVILDCLNTHNEETLIEIFGKAEAERILKRIRFHHTPPHASWLNMAEIEIGILETQCLDRRIPDEFSLNLEVIAWETRRNNQKATIHWTFTRDKAEKTFCQNQSYSTC